MKKIILLFVVSIFNLSFSAPHSLTEKGIITSLHNEIERLQKETLSLVKLDNLSCPSFQNQKEIHHYFMKVLSKTLKFIQNIPTYTIASPKKVKIIAEHIILLQQARTGTVLECYPAVWFSSLPLHDFLQKHSKLLYKIKEVTKTEQKISS